MKEKRIISAILILLLLLSVTGCSTGPAEKDEKNSEAMNLTFIGASTTGTLFMVLNAISECMNMSYPGSIVTIIPGNTVSNPTRINTNEADASLTHNVTAYAAMNGSEPFNSKTENLAAIASLYPSVFQFVVTKEAGLTTMDDFINKQMKLKLSIGQRGSLSEELFLQTIEEYGVTMQHRCWPMAV